MRAITTQTQHAPEATAIAGKLSKQFSEELPKQLSELAVKSLDDDKAEDIVVIDLAGKTSIADYMVVASGRSSRQVGAMAEHLREKLKVAGAPTVEVEGMVRQIQGEMAWNRLLSRNVSPFVNVSSVEVNELYDRLNNLLGLRLSLAAWNRAVTGFRAQLPALSQQATGAHRGLPSSPPRMTKALGRSATSGEKLTFDNISIIEGRRGKQLVAEVTNVDDVEHSASIKATFYDSSNTIVGTRSSVINQVGPGATKTLTIDGVPEHARSKLQIDTLV